MKQAKEKKNKFGILLMIIGLLLIAGSITLLTFNMIEERRADKNAVFVTEQLELLEDEMLDKNEDKNYLMLDGEKYIGIIEIPSINIKLPVQSSCSLQQLRQSPCRYDGNLNDGTLIICAHNYRSHFGYLKDVSIGSKVYFTDVNKHIYTFEVSDKMDINGYDVEKMRQTDYWDLTLFTCTYGGRSRTTLRCIRLCSENTE